MDYYYVNKNAKTTGEHEVHTESCHHLPNKENIIRLGFFKNCNQAIREAEKLYDNVDGCFFCCLACHKK